jgi:hypothetical protein
MAMRILLLLLLAPTLASAQTSVSQTLEQGLKSALQGLAPLPATERRDVLTATAALLAKHVTFRPDGTASSTYVQKENWHIEWRKLVVSNISPAAVTDADRLNGITRRYYASLECEASRNWRPQATTWSEWKPTGFILFPSAIVVEETKGVLVARGNSELPKFQPGPGPSITDKPVTKGQPALPPGMTRGR